MLCRRWPETFLLFSVLSFVRPADATAAREITQPVPLQKSDCAQEPGADFTGHALFSYRIDTTGAVRDIQLLYAEVQPADRKSRYLAELTTCLETWRYRPITVDGTAASATMNVAFHHFPPTTGDEAQVTLPGGREVAASLLKDVRAATLAYTDSLLEARDSRESKGNGWSIRTDLPKSALDDVQAAIEFAHRVFDEAFPGAEAQAGLPDVNVILFRDEKDYQHLTAFDNFIPNRAPVAGHYDPDLRIIYSALGSQPMPFFARTVAHEATHHFAAQRLEDADGRIPRWLGEGIAQYVECARMAKPGKMRLEALDRGMTEQSAVVFAEAYSRTFALPKRVESALLNLKEKLMTVDIPSLLDGRLDDRFMVEGAVTLYDVSWLLVHYLINGDGAQHREAFRKWAMDVEGARNAESLAAAVGIPAKDLSGRLNAYLAKLR